MKVASKSDRLLGLIIGDHDRGETIATNERPRTMTPSEANSRYMADDFSSTFYARK